MGHRGASLVDDGPDHESGEDCCDHYEKRFRVHSVITAFKSPLDVLKRDNVIRDFRNAVFGL